MDISIIILNYKSEHYLAACIASLQEHLFNVSHEIIIVNNDENKISTILPTSNIQIIENNINEGFAIGCNKGAANARGRIFFFLNPDTNIISGDFSDLVSVFSDATIGIVSPQLLTTNNHIQPWSLGYEITLLETICNNIGFVRSKKLWQKDCLEKPDWVSGAAMAISRDLFEKLKGFDEKFFMYFEDVDLCKRALMHGKMIGIISSINILHLGGKSFSNSKQQKKYYYASQDYYFKKHFSFFTRFALKTLRGLVLFFRKD